VLLKSALVTGGAKRIGRELSLEAARMGYNVAIHYNSTEPASLIDEVLALGVECEAFRSDFSDRDALEKLIPAVIKRFPGLKLLVNNASIFKRATIAETTEESFDRHHLINFRAPFILSRDFAASVESGVIVNIVDSKVRANTPSYAAYLLAKKSLDDFTRMAAKEFAPAIRVNGVAPGPILPPPDKGEEYFEKVAGRVPLKRAGTPAEVASAMRFLVESEYITGETIYVDGGGSL
jgi:NAD(P)-dependent dehydrogenase (short-subunit alcohol dehydrogenase family)